MALAQADPTRAKALLSRSAKHDGDGPPRPSAPHAANAFATSSDPRMLSELSRDPGRQQARQQLGFVTSSEPRMLPESPTGAATGASAASTATVAVGYRPGSRPGSRLGSSARQLGLAAGSAARLDSRLDSRLGSSARQLDSATAQHIGSSSARQLVSPEMAPAAASPSFHTGSVRGTPSSRRAGSSPGSAPVPPAPASAAAAAAECAAENRAQQDRQQAWAEFQAAVALPPKDGFPGPVAESQELSPLDPNQQYTPLAVAPSARAGAATGEGAARGSSGGGSRLLEDEALVRKELTDRLGPVFEDNRRGNWQTTSCFLVLVLNVGVRAGVVAVGGGVCVGQEEGGREAAWLHDRAQNALLPAT
jgi:hypothetical protein